MPLSLHQLVQRVEYALILVLIAIVVIPLSVSDEAAREKYGEFTTHLPYLRMTKLPG